VKAELNPAQNLVRDIRSAEEREAKAGDEYQPVRPRL
jgi:hypothetical protein